MKDMRRSRVGLINRPKVLRVAKTVNRLRVRVVLHFYLLCERLGPLEALCAYVMLILFYRLSAWLPVP